ncbi:MAG: hypothetical protein WC329_01875 [Candidatus Omnitrophota bacterium]|jgi:hypothetical protein
MPIANYSTEVTALKSIGEIQGILVAHRAEHILMDYKDGEPIGLSFIIKTQFGETAFRLPANIERIQAVLNKQRIRKVITRDMAARVAWRILRDWVRAQMAILETEMVSIEQIFLPYMETQNGRLLFDVMVEHRLQLPAAN